MTSSKAGEWVARGIGAVWGVCLVRVLVHPIYVSLDSLISYGHVWYISERLWHHARLPLAMPVLGHGEAFAFPYGFLPWVAAALVRPVLGDWSVTLLLVAGATALVASTFLAFPELRPGWWAAAVLVNPALLAALFIGQVPFAWAGAMLLVAIASWRRGRRNWATVFAALAQLTHPAVIGPIVLVLAGWRRLFHHEREIVPRYLISVVVALPAIALVLLSPVFGDSTTWDKVWGFLDTVFPRSLAFAVPIALLWLFRRRVAGAVAFVLVLVLAGLSAVPMSLGVAAAGMSRQPSEAIEPFLRSPAFHPGWTYRLLRTDDKRVSLYALIRAGGRSDAEFFPESELRRPFRSTANYSRVLRERKVDAVMLWRSWEDRRLSDERTLLDELAQPSCAPPLACVRLVDANPQYRLYELSRT